MSVISYLHKCLHFSNSSPHNRQNRCQHSDLKTASDPDSPISVASTLPNQKIIMLVCGNPPCAFAPGKILLLD